MSDDDKTPDEKPLELKDIPARGLIESDRGESLDNISTLYPDIKVEVIAADSEKGELLGGHELNWVVKEYTGVEVCLAPAGMAAAELQEAGTFPEGFEATAVKVPLEAGQYILCPGLTGGWIFGIVDQTPKGDWCFTTGGGLFGALEFGQDDRESWVCTGLVNLQAVVKLNLDRVLSEQEKLERAILNAHRVVESREDKESQADAIDVARWLEQLHAVKFPPKEEEQQVINLDEHRVRTEREFEGEQMLYIEALFGKETFAFDVAIRDIEAMKQGREDPSKPLRPPETDYEIGLAIKHIRWLANEVARLSDNEDWVRPDDDAAVGKE